MGENTLKNVNETKLWRLMTATEKANELFECEIRSGDLDLAIEKDADIGYGNIRVRFEAITITDCDKFADILSDADGLNANCRLDGAIELRILFSNVYKNRNGGARL